MCNMQHFWSLFSQKRIELRPKLKEEGARIYGKVEFVLIFVKL